MKITDFFDVFNVKHLAAYKHLLETGVWPDGFIPDDYEFDSFWRMELACKMAEAYIDFALSGNIYGIPEDKS